MSTPKAENFDFFMYLIYHINHINMGWDGFIHSKNKNIDNIVIRHISYNISDIYNIPLHVSQIIGQYASECPNTKEYRMHIQNFIDEVQAGAIYQALIWNCYQKQQLQAVFVHKNLRSHIILKNERFTITIFNYPDIPLTYIHALETTKNPTINWQFKIYNFITKFDNNANTPTHGYNPPILFT